MNVFNLFALSASPNTGFWENLWYSLYDIYLSADGNYENLGLEKVPLFSIRLTLLGIFIGCVIACIIMLYNKQIIGGAVRKLIASGALAPESAKNVEELGLKKNALAKNALISDSALRRFVKCVEEEQFYREQDTANETGESSNASEQAPETDGETPEKTEEAPKPQRVKRVKYLIDPNTAHFYIPEELRIRAEIKYEQKGSGWVSTLLTILALTVLFFGVLLVLPMILGFIDGLL